MKTKEKRIISPMSPELRAQIQQRAERLFGAASCYAARSKFKTIVADPPWHYGPGYPAPKNRPNCNPGVVKPMPYPTMTLDEIKALPVAELADDDCELYMWTTQKWLPDAFGVIQAWGFKYCGTLTWCKTPRGTGQGGLYCPTTEFLIHGRKGKMPVGKWRKDSTWWNIKRPHNCHSAKPEYFTDMIEEMSDAPRVELFARRQRLGWATWGNEALNHVALVPHNAEVSDGGTLAHESTETRTRRSLH